MKSGNINIRVNPETKEQAEQLFSSLGLTVSEAINVFLHKSLLEGGLPFEVKRPRYNAETEDAIQEIRDIQAGRRAATPQNIDSLLAELGE